MHDLDLIRAAAEDVASARVLLQERIDALEAIVQTALDHGVDKAKVNEASEPLMQQAAQEAASERTVLAA